MTTLRVVSGDTGEVTLDRLSSISQKTTRCPFGAPIGAIINDGTPRLYQTCCNHWNCPVCWRKMAAKVRERIIHGSMVLAGDAKPLFFWTFTCRGRDLPLEAADDGYYEWTNRALANLRYKAAQQKQPWAYVQVTERQQRGHAHSHFIHTFAPDDAEVFQDRKGRFTLSSASFLQAVVDAGLGPQCQITVVDSPEKVALYISGYLKKHINSDQFPSHWRRVRWSRAWPKLPELTPTFAAVLRGKNDFYQADKLSVTFVAETEEIYNYAQHRMIHVVPPPVDTSTKTVYDVASDTKGEQTMAMVLIGYRGHVSFLDNGGQQTTRTYDLRAADAAAAATAMTAIVAAVTAVTDDAVVGYGYGPEYGQDSASLPGSGVENQNQALVETYIAGELTKKATYTIPAPKPSIFTATAGDGANVVDITNEAVLAYQAVFQTGGQAYISDGETAGAILGGKRIHRASRRG